MAIYRPKLGIDSPVFFGTEGTSAKDGTPLKYGTGPAVTLSYETEELDMVATGLVKAYLNGKIDTAITFTLKNFQNESGEYPEDIAIIRAAFATGGGISFYTNDSGIGEIDGDFIVDKMDETRDNGKVISWSVELKPTFSGRALKLGDRTGGTAT